MPSFGGYLNPFSRKHYIFDTGLHYLGELVKGEKFWNLLGYSGTYGLPPKRASIIISMFMLNHYLTGAYYPQGGSGVFRDAFLNALRNNGAEIKNNALVVKIDKKGSEFSAKTGFDKTYT